MHHTGVKDFGDVFGGDFVGQRSGNVDHKINVVEITDSETETEENEKEIIYHWKGNEEGNSERSQNVNRRPKPSQTPTEKSF